jgi:hypothetical protein
MALSIPFLKLINGIPWDTFIKTLTTFVDVLGFLLTPFAKLGTVLGGTGAGSLIAVVGGVASALLVAKTGYDLLTGVLKNLTGTTTSLDLVFKKLQATLATPGGTLSGGLGGLGGGPGGGTDGRGKTGRIDTSKIEGNAARRRAEAINKARDLEDEKQRRIQLATELKKSNPGMTSAEALGSINAQEAATKQSSSYKVGNKLGGLYSSASNAVGKFGESKIGGALGSGKFTVGSWLGSAALDSGANALKENGYGLAGAAASTASGALSGASTGAMLGSLFGPGGAAVGAIGGALIGGISTAFSEYQKSESADELANADAEAVGQSNQYQSQSLDQQKAMARELRQLREDMGYGNAIASRQIAVTETGNRQMANMQYGAQ